jgi:hypothetical protein
MIWEIPSRIAAISPVFYAQYSASSSMDRFAVIETLPGSTRKNIFGNSREPRHTRSF